MKMALYHFPSCSLTLISPKSLQSSDTFIPPLGLQDCLECPRLGCDLLLACPPSSLTSTYSPRHKHSALGTQQATPCVIPSRGHTKQGSRSQVHPTKGRRGQTLWDPRHRGADLQKSTLGPHFHTLFRCSRAQKVPPWGKIQTVILRWGECGKVWAHCVFKLWGWRWGYTTWAELEMG